MASWKAYLLTDTQGILYLADPGWIAGVRETMDGHSVILLRNGSEVGVRLPAKTVMADVAPPPSPPMFTGRLSSTDQTVSFSGGADQGSIINIRDGAQLVATARADQDGRWGTATPVGLTPGEHSLAATQIDVFGRQSEPSPPCVLNVPEPPPPPEPAPASDGPIEIAEDWADLHHSKRIALAKKLAPDTTVDTAAQADEIVAKEVERRQSAANTQSE